MGPPPPARCVDIWVDVARAVIDYGPELYDGLVAYVFTAREALDRSIEPFSHSQEFSAAAVDGARLCYLP
eukprot:11193744-Lingulodinium_polyedra.AAC.1